MKLLIIHNIASSYYKNIVFNALYNRFKDFKVIHLAETQSNREWKVDLSYLNYPYEVLFKGNLDNVKKYKLIKVLIKTLKNESFDILYLGGYSETAYWLSLLFSKIYKKKIIVEMDSNTYTLGRKTLYKTVLKKLFIKLCNYGITYGDLSKDYLIYLGMPEDKIIIKPNVTDNEWWMKKSERLSLKRDELQKKYGFKKYNFIYVGRFSKEKNLFYLLEAYSMGVKEEKNNKWGLIMVGSGPLEKELKDFVKNKNIENIFFTGYKQKDELPEIYSISDVLVLPSLSEPWGVVVNEAMASRVIPLISNRCGAKDLVRSEINGFLFDPLNIERLKNIMKNIILGNYDLNRMKSKAVETIKKYNSDFAAEKIIELIDRIKTEESK